MIELVPRKEIYAGSLIYLPKLDINESVLCRGMLFKLTKDNLTHDLIYTTPTNYPLYDNNSNIKSNFLITNYINLDLLLAKLNFDVVLNQDNLNTIYKKFISHYFWINHNKQLFDDELLPRKIYDALLEISKCKTGNPYKEEEGYAFIKRRQ